MYMAASNIEDIRSRNLTPLKGKIAVLAAADIFSECLVQALGIKFPECDVVSIAETDEMDEEFQGDLRLVLIYNYPLDRLLNSLPLLLETCPDISVGLIVESITHIDPNVVRLMEKHNIHGVLPLNQRLDVFMAAIDLLMKGGEHFPSTLLLRLAADTELPGRALSRHRPALVDSQPLSDGNASASRRATGEFVSLTTREVQILDLICKGTQNKIIADQLHLSENTVKVHVRNIYKKMNVRNRTEAASRFFNSDASSRLAPQKWSN